MFDNKKALFAGAAACIIIGLFVGWELSLIGVLLIFLIYIWEKSN